MSTTLFPVYIQVTYNADLRWLVPFSSKIIFQLYVLCLWKGWVYICRRANAVITSLWALNMFCNYLPETTMEWSTFAFLTWISFCMVWKQRHKTRFMSIQRQQFPVWCFIHGIYGITGIKIQRRTLCIFHKSI